VYASYRKRTLSVQTVRRLGQSIFPASPTCDTPSAITHTPSVLRVRHTTSWIAIRSVNLYARTEIRGAYLNLMMASRRRPGQIGPTEG
jgi:hypothetical protein